MTKQLNISSNNINFNSNLKSQILVHKENQFLIKID